MREVGRLQKRWLDDIKTVTGTKWYDIGLSDVEEAGDAYFQQLTDGG